MIVAKLGGSLFDQPQVEQRLADWLTARREQAIVLIVGGGKQVDQLRQSHSRGELTDEAAHWQAIRLMDKNTNELQKKLTTPHNPQRKLWDLSITRRLQDLQRIQAPALFAPGKFLQETEPHLPGCRLPIGWQVTSDSIAARVAEVLAADLVLLKAVLPPEVITRDIEGLAEAGYVDAFFPRASLGLRKVLFQTL